jgi:hypothetical protein
MRIANFGDDSVAIDRVDTFGWYGNDIRTNPNFSPLDVLDLAEEMQESAQGEQNSVQSAMLQATMMKRQLRMIVHPDDFDTFWRIAKEKRITPETLMQVMESVIQYITARPTVPQSDSSDGRQSITTTSVSTHEEPVSPLTALDERVLERDYPGRPDVALTLVNIAERRHVAAG